MSGFPRAFWLLPVPLLHHDFDTPPWRAHTRSSGNAGAAAKKSLRPYDEARLSSLTVGATSNTGVPCSLVYCLSPLLGARMPADLPAFECRACRPKSENRHHRENRRRRGWVGDCRGKAVYQHVWDTCGCQCSGAFLRISSVRRVVS